MRSSSRVGSRPDAATGAPIDASLDITIRRSGQPQKGGNGSYGRCHNPEQCLHHCGSQRLHVVRLIASRQLFIEAGSKLSIKGIGIAAGLARRCRSQAGSPCRTNV